MSTPQKVRQGGPLFGNGDRVYDKGVWKRFKYCSHCQKIITERAKWKDCWDDIKYCSDRCRSSSRKGGE